MPHKILVQFPGDVLLLSPGSYFQAYGSGAYVGESMCWADGASATRAAGFVPCHAPCRLQSRTALSPETLIWYAGWPAAEQLLPEVRPTRVVPCYKPVSGPLWRPGDGIGGSCCFRWAPLCS